MIGLLKITTLDLLIGWKGIQNVFPVIRWVPVGDPEQGCRRCVEDVTREFTQRRRPWLRKRHLKVNLRCLKLNRAYSISFNSSNVGKLFWSWILKDSVHQSSGREKERSCLLFPSSTKREIRQFHVVVVQRRQRNLQKKVMYVQSCLFCWSKLISDFLPFSLLSPSPSPSSFRKLPNNQG